jgi:hypothetical protein
MQFIPRSKRPFEPHRGRPSGEVHRQLLDFLARPEILVIEWPDQPDQNPSAVANNLRSMIRWHQWPLVVRRQGRQIYIDRRS